MSLNSEYFDVEKLIVEIEKRPILYNKSMPEYSDKNVKIKMWAEVCESVVTNWKELDQDARIKKGNNDVQRKWKNLRDSFRKELSQQKKTVSGEGQRKRRKYMYFEQLLFLVPTLRERETSGNFMSPSNDDADEAHSDSVTVEERVKHSQTSETSRRCRGNEKKPKKPTYEESLLQILNRETEEIDEDKSFLLSLWPSFKKMTSQQKLTTKIGFLQILQQQTVPQPSYSTSFQSVGPGVSSYFPQQMAAPMQSFQNFATNSNIHLPLPEAQTMSSATRNLETYHHSVTSNDTSDSDMFELQ